ncbi:MAG: hypothetical protein KA165_05355 [Saprospiraceae bacterium]|nr:hypothetical protein [Saprospiraceae bacterium]
MRSFLYKDNELLDPDDNFTIDFSDYKDGQGKTYWQWLTFIVNAKDRSGGVYSVMEDQKSVYRMG